MTDHSIGRIGLVVATLVTAATTACGGATGDSSETGGAALSSSAMPYLALGDSIAFGDDGYVSWTDPSRANAASFVGYPFEVARILYGSPSKAFDLACPGETTGSFLSATAADNGCRTYKGEDPLHEPYTGTQMSAAASYLRANPWTRLVTITLGGNDLLLAQTACQASSNFAACVLAAIPGVVATATANVGAIMAGLRSAGYFGEIVFLTQYATNYNDLTQLAAIPLFNSGVGAAVSASGGKVANGFDAFAIASALHGGNPCAAGLLIPNPNGSATCDKHPSAAGRKVLADAVVFAR